MSAEEEPKHVHENGSLLLETDFDAMLNNIECAVLLTDAAGKVLNWNKYPEHFQGLIDKPLHFGESIFSFIPLQWRPLAQRILRNVADSKQSSTVDVNCNDALGDTQFFEITCKYIAQLANHGERILVEVKDVTSQKIFEKKLSAMTTELSTLVESANAVIISVDSTCRVTNWNEMSSRLTGTSKVEVLTRKIAEVLVDVVDQPVFSFNLQQVLEGRPLINYELRIKAANSKQLTLFVNINPKRNSEGLIVGALIIGQDITELVEYRKSLELKVMQRTKELTESNQLIQQQKEMVEMESAKSDRLLLNILPAGVALELKQKGNVVPRRFEMTSILFADLIGFTALSKDLSPEELINELNYIIVGFDMILEKNGMEKIKVIGDGYMAVAGIPLENRTNPIDAVRAGLQMIDYVSRIRKSNEKELGPPWQVRVGINTGPLIAGVIGKNKFAYDVWGASVNAASRMESVAMAGTVNISEATYLHVMDQFYCKRRDAIEVKGLGTMNTYQVERERI